MKKREEPTTLFPRQDYVPLWNYRERQEDNREITKCSTELICAFMDRRISRHQFLAGVDKLHEQFPGVGFDESARSLSSFYSKTT